MPGIRIKSPVGDDWQYSLDKLTWQTLPVFYKLPGGSPFLEGKTYPVYYRNEVLHQQGQDSIIFGQPDTEGAALSRSLRKLTDADIRYLCARLGAIGCAGSGSGPVIVPKFSFIHYEFVDKPVEPTYDYVVGDGTYAGTFDAFTESKISGWAVKRGVGSQSVDIKGRIKGSLEALRTVQLNVTPSVDRQDVVDAPGINTPSGKRCGFEIDTPDSLKTGEEWEIHVFIAGTDTELKTSPRYLVVPQKVQPVANAYQISGKNIDEGGLGQQQVLQQKWSDNSYRDVAARNWEAKDDTSKPITGVSIAGGLFKAAAGSVSQTVFVTIGCQPADSDQFVSARRQIVDTDGCARESGLSSFTGTYAMAPNPGNSRRFDSLADANQAMGVYYDNPTQWTPSQFKFQCASISVGTKIYNRDNVSTCERVDDGLYYVSDSTGGNTVKKAIRVKDGVIAEVLASTYATPAPVPDTSWATLYDPFDVANPNYLQSNGTVWTYGGGMACVNLDTIVRDDTGALILDVAADRILARLTVGARDVLDPRYGVGLKYTRDLEGNGSGKGGYNLLLTRNNNTNLVQFLFDHIAFGPYYAYEWQPYTTYYIAMQYTRPDANTRRLLGKVWPVTDIEPTDWPYSWDVASRSGQAAVVGGSNHSGDGNKAAGCVDAVWVQTQNVAPRLIDVALGKPVIAPANTLGGGWAKERVTDTDPGSSYSTDCLAENTPLSIIVDAGGTAAAEQIAFQMRPELPGAFPIDYTVDGSNDGQIWSTLLTMTNQPRQSAELILNLPSPNGGYGEYRYWRLRSTKNGRAADSDCIRVQVAGFRVLAPKLNPLADNQKMSVLEIGRAFVGAAGSNGSARRDLLYFVKNGVTPSSATGIAPTWGFKNLTTGSPDSLAGKSEMYSIDQWGDPGSAWASVFNQAKAQGFVWFAYANAGSAGQKVRFRFGGNASETAYKEFDFTVPDDGTNLNLTTIFPV